MSFTKGQSGNPTGRPPGIANRATQTVRDKFAQLLDGYDVQQLRADLNAIENPKDRLSILLGLAEFVTPKLQRTSLQPESHLTAIRIIDYTDAELVQIIAAEQQAGEE